MTAAQAFFLPAPQGQRYAVLHAPAQPPRSLVLQAHPFAEELNKTRRMAALQSRALAVAGHAVLQVDLLGCGDSSGDFGDAGWQDWIDDLLRAQAWLVQRYGAALPLWLWGLRAGCLLAADAAHCLPAPCNLLFWQPGFADGALQLQQFLRLRLAADMLGGSDPARGAMQALREQLAQGQALQIAGYRLSPALAGGLQASRLVPPPVGAATAPRLAWLEVAAAETPRPSPLAVRTTDAWRQAGWQVHLGAATGPAFWQSAEIEDAPALVQATLDALAA